jgi:hypothetical protein
MISLSTSIANPNLSNALSFDGEENRHTNQIKISNEFDGYKEFLISKVPCMIIKVPTTTTTIITINLKKCQPTPAHALHPQKLPYFGPHQKARIELFASNTTTDSTARPNCWILPLLIWKPSFERTCTLGKISSRTSSQSI